jgi:transcriptional regulator with XRE-family HTH domain
MDARLTFGETIRRLRRQKKWSLGTLAEATGLSYSFLSRVENDSASPEAKTVARLAEALDGDLRELLELADCLPEVILNRIARRQDSGMTGAFNRSAGESEPPAGDSIGALVTDLALVHGLPASEAYGLADAIERLMTLPAPQRAAIAQTILTLDSNRDDQ